jgi:hypothetical protein
MRRLLTGVVTSPRSPQWFIDEVRDVTRRYGLSEKLVVSSQLQVGVKIKDLVYQSFHKTHRVSRIKLIEVPWRKPPWKKK